MEVRRHPRLVGGAEVRPSAMGSQPLDQCPVRKLGAIGSVYGKYFPGEPRLLWGRVSLRKGILV